MEGHGFSRVSVICTRPSEEKKTVKQEVVVVEVKVEVVECPICGEDTTEHLHYGGLSCASCKAFFRRIVAVHRTPRRPCRLDGRCSLQRQHRNNCPACRFQRCLDNGLRPELVMSGRAQRSDRTSTMKGARPLPPHRPRSASPPPLERPPSPNPLEPLERPGSSPDPWSAIMAHHRLVLSQTAGINLLLVPPRVLGALGARIREEQDRPGVNEEVLSVARIEAAFLEAKQCVVFFQESLTSERLEESRRKGIYPALVFTSVQEFFVQLVVIFLRHCPFFQSLTWACQARLLRKNIAEISILLVTMCFDRDHQVFRWGLSARDQSSARERGLCLGPVVEVDQACLALHLSEQISGEILTMVTSLAQLDIPNHVHILLILIQVFTRDGLQMEKQSKVDLARAHYLHLLYRYMEVCHAREQCSRLTATMHRALHSVTEFAEKMRAFEISSVRT